MRLLPCLPLLLLAGCPGRGPFLLADLERLVVGQSTREEVEALLGPPEETRHGVAIYRTWTREPFPPFPLGFVTWPLFLVSTFENVVVCAGYGADHVLQASWLTYSTGSGGAVLLAPLCGAAETPDAETLAALRQLEDHGVQVGVASGHRGRPWVRPSELLEDESRRRD